VPLRDRERLAAVRQQTASELTSVTATTETKDVHAARRIPVPHRLAGATAEREHHGDDRDDDRRCLSR